MIGTLALALSTALVAQRPADRPLQRVMDTQRLDSLIRAEKWRDAIPVAERLGNDSSTRELITRLRVNAGIAALQQGNRAQAIRDWSTALLEKPTSIEASLNLSMALLEERRTDSARAVVTSALRHHPDDGRLLALRARTLSGPEGMEATLVALRRLRKERPHDESIGLDLAQLLVSSGGNHRLEGMVLCDSLVSSPQASERAYVTVAELWMNSQQPQSAAQVADLGVVRFPRSLPLWTLLAEASAAREPPNYIRAASAYRRAIVLSRQPASLERALMAVLKSAHDTTAAIALADGWLERDSMDVRAIEERGQLAASAGDTARAIMLFTRALALDSSGPEPALAILDLRRPPPPADSARRLLRQAIWRGLATLQGLELMTVAAASAPASPARLARMRPEVQRHSEVTAALRRALDTVVFRTDWGRAELEQLRLAYPRSTLLARYTADVAAGTRSTDSALAMYDLLVRRDPANAGLQASRGALLETLGRTDDAIDAYTRALDLAPENDTTFRTLQRLLAPRGTLDLLLTQLRRLRQRLPQSKLLIEHEVEVLSRMGRYSEAQEIAKQLQPEKKDDTQQKPGTTDGAKP